MHKNNITCCAYSIGKSKHAARGIALLWSFFHLNCSASGFVHLQHWVPGNRAYYGMEWKEKIGMEYGMAQVWNGRFDVWNGTNLPYSIQIPHLHIWTWCCWSPILISVEHICKQSLSWTKTVIRKLRAFFAISVTNSNADAKRRQARSQGGNVPPPIPNVAPKIFTVIKVLMRKPKKYFSANQRHCLRNLLHQPSVEPDSCTVFYQLSRINETLCTWGSENLIQVGK